MESLWSVHAAMHFLVFSSFESRDIFHIRFQVYQTKLSYYFRTCEGMTKSSFLVSKSGCEAVFDLNQSLRVDRPLLRAFGYEKCADQSVIQTTLNAATQENVQEMEDALKAIWDENNLTAPLLEKAQREGKIETIDMDLSGMPASKNAEKSEKGYFAGKRNIYGRQLGRILVPETQEIVADCLYPGNRLSCKVFKDMVKKMEQVLPLGVKVQRRLIRLRLDGGFGTDANINYALWRGYHLLVKMYSGNR